MNNHILQKTEIERDLGVIISNDLEWSQHVISATNKANRQLGIIKHAFTYLDIDTLKLLYKSMVRLILNMQLQYGAQLGKRI
jgi:serine acetyltransferase